MPIAFLETVYRNNGSIKREELAYITPDHLNTPRLATNDAQQITWTWRSDAFSVGKIEKAPVSSSNYVPAASPDLLSAGLPDPAFF